MNFKINKLIIYLFFCLLSLSLSPALPATAATTEYTMEDLMNSSLPKGATILLESRKDLESLDSYINDGMLRSSYEYTFRLNNDIAVSDYTFRYDKSTKTISIYYKDTLASVYDENTFSFYTDESLQTPADFTFEGTPWKPVGSSSKPFCATFDGNGHKITGLWNTSSDSSFSARTESGLFACLKNAAISDLTIDGAFLQLSYGSDSDDTRNNSGAVGLLSGYCDNSTIRNCHLQNAFIDIENHSNASFAVGGLCGQGDDNVFENTSASASIHLSARQKNPISAENASEDSSGIAGACGMLMGYSDSNHSITLSNCNTSGHIVDHDSSYIAGGLCGEIIGSPILINCQNHADILSACIAGGLIGFIEMDSKEYALDSSGKIPSDTADSFCIYINRAVNTASINGIYAGGIVGISYDYAYFTGDFPSGIDYYRPLTILIGSENSGTIRSFSRGGGMIALAGCPYLKDCSNRGMIVNTTAGAISAKDRSFIPLAKYDPANAKLFTADIGNIRKVSACIGGLIGQTYHSTYIYNCYNDADIKTNFAVCGGLIGRTTEQNPCKTLIMENCFHCGTIHVASNSTAPAISTVSPSSSDPEDTSADHIIRRPVLTASLIGYCYNNYNKRKVNYCYTTEADLPYCGYWPYSILDGSALSNNISAVKPSNSCIVSSSQLCGNETAINIGTSTYNSYPDLLSCLNAWIANSENTDRAYVSTCYFPKSPQTWSGDTEHPCLILSDAPDPRNCSPLPTPSYSWAPVKSPSPAKESYIPPPTATFPASTDIPSPAPTSPPENTPTEPSAATSSPDSMDTASSSPSLSKPDLLAAKANKTGGIRIVWHNTSLCDGYFVCRAMGKHAKYSLAATLNTSQTRKYFTTTFSGTGTRCTFIDTNIKPNRTYYYKVIPYTLQNGEKISGTASNRRRVLSRIMAPVLTVQRKTTPDGQRFLRITLLKYQGRYADIYIRKNNKKYTLLQLKNDNIKKQKKTFDLRYTFRKATIGIKVQTFQNKKRSNGSFYSRETIIQINE